MGTLRDAKHHSAELIWTSAAVTKIRKTILLGACRKLVQLACHVV